MAGCGSEAEMLRRGRLSAMPMLLMVLMMMVRMTAAPNDESQSQTLVGYGQPLARLQ